MKKISSLSLILTTLVSILAGCSRDPLQPLALMLNTRLNYVSVDARFCTLPRSPGKQKIKYLFVLDHSQSNQPGFPSPLTPNDVSSTDPNGSRRYGPLAQFLRNLIPDPNNLTYFGLIDFDDKAYLPTGITGFDSDSTNFLNNAVTDWIGAGTAVLPAPLDKGFTNYQAALKLAQQIIQQDAQGEAVNPTRPITTISYKIVFVSDGIPNVISSSSPNQIYTQDFNTDILPVINQILSIKSDPALGPFIANIELDTAYYFQNVQTPAAETLLQQMATVGGGQYFQFGFGKDIAYQNFAPPSRNVKFNLTDAYVENENAVWWDDGRLLTVSDGTGMPDEIKMKLNGTPNQRDSDGNGVSDLVEYRTKGKICNDASCAPKAHDPYAICAGLSPKTQTDGSIAFPFSSASGFNDCEAFLLGLDLNTFSTNGTMIPDLLAFKNGLPILPGSDGTVADPFGDGMTNYTKLKLGLPVSVSKKKVLNFKTRVITMTHEESQGIDTECYHMRVDNVAVLGDDNTIKFFVVQNTSVLDDKPVLKFAERKVVGQQSPVIFSPGDFQ